MKRVALYAAAAVSLILMGEAGAEDAKVAGTDFDATSEVPCGRGGGQPMTTCQLGVKRAGNGKADVTIFWPDGGTRVIFFEGGEPRAVDASEADGSARLSWEKQVDLYLIRFGEQRFEIPDIVVLGD